MKGPRLLGPALMVVLFLAAYVAWRTGVSSAPDDAADEPPSRGGQLVTMVPEAPQSFNPIAATDETTALIGLLTQGKLVRIDRTTFDLEPWLAERWESAGDGLTHTLFLRPGVAWSDGAPLTAADVVFSLDAVFNAGVSSPLAALLSVGGRPIRARASDAQTVVFSYPVPSGMGVRLLDALTILPRHKLEAALAAGSFDDLWNPGVSPAEVVGTGPFLLREYLRGERLVFERNPRYWRRAPDGMALPYLDRVVVDVVAGPQQPGRLEAGTADLLLGELAPDDYVPMRRAETEGRVRVLELGVSIEPDALWFCLKPETRRADPRFGFVQRVEFRQAISHAVDREAFAETAFLGAAVPVWGPITTGNRLWFWPDVPRYPPDDARARELLRSIGLEDRNANGVVEDAAGVEARFTVLTQAGLRQSERATTVLREELAGVGIAIDLVPLEPDALAQRMLACDYDAVYARLPLRDVDPAGNLDTWLSSGSSHVWNPRQRTPLTSWEQRIDTIMLEQAATLDPEQRRLLFNDVQRILAENLPAVYFAAPRLYTAHSPRVLGASPSVLRPSLLWSVDTLWVRPD